MPRPSKGQRIAGSGRKPGQPNSSTLELFAICEKHGVDVFEGMVMLAATELNKDKKFDKLLKIAPYLYAQRKAVEVAMDPEANGIRIIVEDYTVGKK